jgi:hypothetical protein
MEVGDSLPVTQAGLAKVLLAANEAAIAKGAPAGSGGLAIRLDGPLPANVALSELPLSEHDILADYADLLQKNGPRKVIVGVRVARRFYEGERDQVHVELWGAEYHRIFVADEVICAVTIDGSRPRGEIFTELWNLVRTLVHNEAHDRGLLANPGTGQYGKFPAPQLLEALDAIAAQKRPVRVLVRAAKDTYTYTPDGLTIRIDLKSGDTTTGDHGTGS